MPQALAAGGRWDHADRVVTGAPQARMVPAARTALSAQPAFKA